MPQILGDVHASVYHTYDNLKKGIREVVFSFQGGFSKCIKYIGKLLRPKKKLIVSQALCFKCPSSVFFFSDLNKKSGLIYFFRCQNQNIGIFMLKMNKKGVSLCFDQIKIKKSGLICFLGNKN